MIRDAHEADIEAITRICNHYIVHSTANFEEHPTSEADMLALMRSIVADGCPYLVAVDDASDAVMGYCYAHQWREKSAYRHTLETTIYLDPAATRQGLGTRLMQVLIDRCRVMGIHTLVADITDENEASLRMHERLGFTAVSHFTQVGLKFGRWLGDVDMQLIL